MPSVFTEFAQKLSKTVTKTVDKFVATPLVKVEKGAEKTVKSIVGGKKKSKAAPKKKPSKK
jgi:hypothetical protein